MEVLHTYAYCKTPHILERSQWSHPLFPVSNFIRLQWAVFGEPVKLIGLTK
jgi:hypothetical protein